MQLVRNIKEFTARKAADKVALIKNRFMELETMAIVQNLRDYAAKKAAEQVIWIATKVRDLEMDDTCGDLNVLSESGKRALMRLQAYLPLKKFLKMMHVLFYIAFYAGQKRRYLFEAKHGFYPPFIMIISPTMRCNISCVGCYSRSYVQDYGLTQAELDRIITEGKAMGIHFVTFLGGEPFIRKDLYEIYEKHSDVFFQTYTNGTLMTPKIVDRLSKFSNLAIIFSLEGFEKETDARRGKGVYRRVMESMDVLRHNKVVFGTSSTVSRQNSEVVSSDEFIDMLIEKGALAHHYYQYVPVAGDKDLSYMSTPWQRNTLRQRIAHIRATKPIFIIDFWNDGPLVGGCIAGARRYFHVNSKGDVEPCVYTHFALDNIREKSLEEVLINSPLFKSVRRRQPHSENHLTPCMIIDNPWVLREIVAETGARPTHEGAESILIDLKEMLDDYARQMHQLTDKVWEEQFKPKFASRTQDSSFGRKAAC